MTNNTGEIGIETPAARYRRSLLLPAVCLSLICAGAAGFYQARGMGQLTACQSNLLTIQSVLTGYAREHHHRLPSKLSDPEFRVLMPKIPTCPAAGRDTYSSGYESNGFVFTVSCRGDNHRHFLPGPGTANLPSRP